MMNMAQRLRLANKSQKKEFTWKKEWVRPYESIWSILFNFCKVNVISGKMALKKLGCDMASAKIIYDGNMMMYGSYGLHADDYKKLYGFLLPRWYMAQMKPYMNMNIYTAFDLVNSELYFCPECGKEGYHSIFHQLTNMRVCPFHGNALIKAKAKEQDLPYTAACIKYSEKAYCFSNARASILPVLRVRNNDYYTLDSKFKYSNVVHHTHEKLAHFIWHEGYKKDAVFPAKLFLSKKPDKKIRIAHFSGNTDNLWASFMNGFHHPRLMYLFSVIDKDLNEFADYMYKKGRIQFKDYFLYCEIMTFALEHNITDYSDSYLNLSDSTNICINDKRALAYSFLYTITRFFGPYEALFIRLVLRPRTIEYVSYRELDNYLYLHRMAINAAKMNISAADNLLADFYLIDDMFNCLWEHYLKLAARPYGVTIDSAWYAGIVPDYYLCWNDSEKYLYLYRYDKASNISKG